MAKITPIVVGVTNGEDAASQINEAIKTVEVDGTTVTGDGISTPLSAVGVQSIPISWLKIASLLDADPLAGNIGFNNADLSQVTEIYLSNTSHQPMNVAEMLADSEGSGILIQQKNDDSKYIIFLAGAVTDNTTYHKFVVSEYDSGAIFDDGAELITTYTAKVSSGSSGGHTIQQDGVATDQESVLNIITNGLKTVIENVAGVATNFTLKFLSMFDVDPTGLTDGDLFVWNETTGKIERKGIVVYDNTFNTSDVINANGILSSDLEKGYAFIKIVAKNESGAAITVSIGSVNAGTDIVSAAVVSANSGESLTIVKDFFDFDTDTPLYVTSSDVTGNLTLYFTSIKTLE